MSESDKNLHCSFCDKNAQEVKKLIAGPSVYICDECVDLCYSILFAESSKTLDKDQDDTKEESKEVSEPYIPSPKEIKDHMDKYIIGQDYAKMIVSVAVYNHYIRLKNPKIDDVEIDKSNVLLYGPSGSGKCIASDSLINVKINKAVADFIEQQRNV